MLRLIRSYYSHFDCSKLTKWENTMVPHSGFGVGTPKWFLVKKNVPKSKTFVPKLKINVLVVLIKKNFSIKKHFFSIKEQWCRYTKTTLMYQSVTLYLYVNWQSCVYFVQTYMYTACRQQYISTIFALQWPNYPFCWLLFFLFALFIPFNDMNWFVDCTANCASIIRYQNILISPK